MTKNLRSNIVATVDVSTPQKRVLANQREEVRGLELDERKEKILKAILIWKSLVTFFSRILQPEGFLPIRVTGFMLTRSLKRRTVRSSTCRN